MNQSSGPRRERRYYGIVFFVFGLLVLSRVAHYFLSEYSEQHWGELVEAKSAGLLQDAATRFISLQRDTRRIATDLPRRSEVVDFLDRQATDATSLFEAVSEGSRKHNVGVEVVDDRGTLIAWSGTSGPLNQKDLRLALDGIMTSYVLPSPLYSQLVVTTPVRVTDRIVGVVIIRYTIDIHYPLNKRYVDRVGFSERANRDLGAEFSFDSKPGIADSLYTTGPLFGIDSTIIGTLRILNPTLQAYQEDLDLRFRYADGLIQLSLALLISFALWHRIRLLRNTALKCVLVTLLVWVSRYLLIWMEIPSLYFEGGLFDPEHYASTFGGGIAKSVGELTISSFALIVNTVVVLRLIAVSPGQAWKPQRLFLAWALAAILAMFLFVLLRAYAAIVRSAVFDSSLMLTDPTVVIPMFVQALMVVNLFTISLCFVLVATTMVSYIGSLVMPGTVSQNKMGTARWFLTAGLLAAAAVAFGLVQGNALTSLVYRLTVVAGVVAYSASIRQGSQSRGMELTPGLLLIPLGLSALFLYPQLDARTAEKDRQRIEVFASEFLRPVDSWLTFVVDESLQLFLEDEVLEVLENGNMEETGRLALSVWSKSSVCREGYSCLFLLTDSLGNELSSFSIGNQSILTEHRQLLRGFPTRKSIRIQQTGRGIGEFKVYRGSTPVATDERLVGYAHVLVVAGQQTLFRGDLPAFLRSPAPESLEAFYRTVTVAEFHQGKLFASTTDVVPPKTQLPDQASPILEEGAPASFWTETTVGGNSYETLVVRGATEDQQVVLLLLPAQEVIWRAFNAIKLLFWYFLLVLFILGVYLLVRWISGIPYRPTFRDKLLVALLLTAIIPLVVIAYYGKGFAEERLMKQTAKRLEQETDAFALRIRQDLEDGVTQWRQEEVEEIAAQLGADYNFYFGRNLERTSRPELYAAGLLDRRIDGNAYLAVAVKGQRFLQQTENVGSYRYAVGYRSVTDSDGNILGIVSVPTIYRQDELDQQIARQNAFLFGVYAVVFLAIFVVATTVAGRIASPIHRLTEATRRVSRGELDVTLSGVGADGEIGELVRSFEKMTRDLKAQRDELVKYEREHAWKEMAKQVAHEIKNPLTPMKLSLQHLRQTYRDKISGFDQILEEIVTSVVEQIDALSRIASEFSRFARMPSANLERCDVKIVLEEGIRLFEQEEGFVFQRNFGVSPLIVLADREELRRAFINLIRNGMQAMGNRGLMIVGAAEKSANAEIILRDFGVGIPEDIREKLFQPNFSTKTDGMGLGLPIVKKTIDNLGGSIRIEDANGKGTVVTILLPLVKVVERREF